jgi:hypothetical protein
MTFNALIIKKPGDWETLTRSVNFLSRDKVSEMRYITSVEDLTEDPAVVDVVLMAVTGQADYAIEIYGLDLSDNAVGMHIAVSTGQPYERLRRNWRLRLWDLTHLRALAYSSKNKAASRMTRRLGLSGW